MIKRSLLIAILLLLFSIPASAGKYDGWTSFTSFNRVHQIEFFEDSIQVVTSGGWLKIDPVSLGMRKLDNISGLGTNDIYDILNDDSGFTWLAAFGKLIKYDNGNIEPFLFFDDEQKLMTLYSISDDGDWIWTGASTGLALFSKIIDGGQIQEFYFRFGTLNPNVRINDIVLDGTMIYIATEDGFAMTDRSDPIMMKSPANWFTAQPSAYLPDAQDSIRALAVMDNNIYLGTSAGLYRLNVSPADTSMEAVSLPEPYNIRGLKIKSDTLYIFGSLGVYRMYDGTAEPVSLPGMTENNIGAGYIDSNMQWIGTFSDGIYYEEGGTFHKYEDNGLPAEYVPSISSDSAGNVVAAFDLQGMAHYDGASWAEIPFDYTRSGVRVLSYDSNNNLWVGSWGLGSSVIMPDTTINFGEANSTLHGVPEDYNYIAINGMTSYGDYVFILNYFPRDDHALHIVDINSPDSWISFGPPDGIPYNILTTVAADDEKMVVGTIDHGLYYYYFGESPFDKADDSVVNLTEQSSWLNSDNINTAEFDNDGVLWVGTRFGLSRYDPGIDRFVNVNLPFGFGPDVTQLAFDRRDNLWIGARNGLARFDAGTGNIEVFTKLNSGLIDNEITDLSINPKTGDLFIATRKGISKWASQIGEPTSIIDQVVAFPNPFRIKGGSDFLSFNYQGNATVYIFTVNGELIWENDIYVNWRGKNQEGKDVASGVYLFLLKAEDGSIGKGKIFLVRE